MRAMGEEWLITDGWVETASDLEMFARELHRCQDDPYRWKWTILALYSGLQGMIVLALQGSNGLHVLRPEDADRWLEAHERGDAYPRDLRLDNFLSLYKKVKSEIMLMYSHSKRFIPKGSQERSVRGLHRLRNQFVHFTPKLWALDLAGLPNIAFDCLSVAEFLAWESHNVIWEECALKQRLRSAFSSAHALLNGMRTNRRED